MKRADAISIRGDTATLTDLAVEGEQLIGRLNGTGQLTPALRIEIEGLCDPSATDPLDARVARIAEICVACNVPVLGLSRWLL